MIGEEKKGDLGIIDEQSVRADSTLTPTMRFTRTHGVKVKTRLVEIQNVLKKISPQI